MMNNRIIGLILMMVSPFCFSQSLDQYEYVIIPATYDFLKSENQYELNDLTKFLFEKEGFKVIYDNKARSVDFTKDQCAGLIADLENKSSMFTTKLLLTLRDCNDKVVWKSLEGKSKLKDYKKGYHEALRKALASLGDLNYAYAEKEADEVKFVTSEPQIVETQKAPEKVKSIADKKEKLEEVKVEVTENTKSVEVPKKETEVEQIESVIPAIKAEQPIHVADNELTELLYAQATPDGFQLINNVPELVYSMVKSTKDDLYILKNKNGIIYKNLGRWFVEYYEDNKLMRETIQIKF